MRKGEIIKVNANTVVGEITIDAEYLGTNYNGNIVVLCQDRIAIVNSVDNVIIEVIYDMKAQL